MTTNSSILTKMIKFITKSPTFLCLGFGGIQYINFDIFTLFL